MNIVADQVLPVVEIKAASGWYDFDAKYVTGDTQYIVPADLSPATTATTATSLLPKAAQAAGITFPALCGRIMERATAQAGERWI